MCGCAWGCAWGCGCTYCAITRVGRWHTCTHMHTSGIALQIICATIHTHVVILTMSPRGHKTHQSPTYLLPPPPHTHSQLKGSREKNTDLMRQDIVDVLKTTKQNLVRALIGLSSVAAGGGVSGHSSWPLPSSGRQGGYGDNNPQSVTH